MNRDDANLIVAHATHIGDILESNHPTRRSSDGNSWGIPQEDVKDIADTITLVVAQILQSWLDAGSERDVTFEELGDPIRAHVLGWSINHNQ